MKKFIVRVFVVLGVVYLITIVAALTLLSARRGTVPSTTILEANFEQPLVEDVPETTAAKLTLTDRTTIRDVVDAIDRGANDDRVKGMVARIGAVPMGMAQTQELREAVQRFRSHKKFAIAYAETFGEFGPGNGAYYLATSFDQIYLQPSGDVGLTGVMLETPFVKGTLEKLGMRFHGDHRYEYKNALNTFTETKYTAPHKEALEKVLNSWFGQLKEGICTARQIAPDQFQALVDKGPYLGKEALDAKLVDGLAYRDEVSRKLRKKPATTPSSSISTNISSAPVAPTTREKPSRWSMAPVALPAAKATTTPSMDLRTWARKPLRARSAQPSPTRTSRRSCSASTAPADPTSPPTPSGARS